MWFRVTLSTISQLMLHFTSIAVFLKCKLSSYRVPKRWNLCQMYLCQMHVWVSDAGTRWHQALLSNPSPLRWEGQCGQLHTPDTQSSNAGKCWTEKGKYSKHTSEANHYNDQIIATRTQRLNIAWIDICCLSGSVSCICCVNKTSQELQMLSRVTLNCEVIHILMNLGSQ